MELGFYGFYDIDTFWKKKKKKLSIFTFNVNNSALSL